MHILIRRRAIHIAMLATAAFMMSSCGHHDDANDSNSTGSRASNSNSGAGGSDSGSNTADIGDNDMDSNVAQVDTANSTIVGGQTGSNAAVNGPM